jgi:Holliday junction resolvase RusA-like endonuclease
VVPLTEIRLPFPPSVNSMFGNNKRGKGRGRYRTDEYEHWIAEATAALWEQRPRPVLGRCEVWIDLDDRRRGDADNRAKPVLDLLVKHGTLGGDSERFVRRVSIGWTKVDGCRVAIAELA